VYTIEAPCKINLFLRIGKKRPDGFHNLESIFAPLALSDTLRFECNGQEGESVLSINHEVAGGVAGPEIMPENNLVLKAVSLFRERAGFSHALRIRLDKRIPVGAGLGGGSSDAAATLLALNMLADQALAMGQLAEMAAILGSDVPFFLTGGAAFASGRGERLEPVKTPGGWVLLVKPPFSSDTAGAYRLLDEAREQVQAETAEEAGPSKAALLKALAEDPVNWRFHNDFLPVFLKRKGAEAAAYKDILESLKKLGASFAGLSGSGSCCFGIFPTKEAAEKALKAEKQLSDGKNYLNLTFFLAQKVNTILEY